jgi:hypothetical protein
MHIVDDEDLVFVLGAGFSRAISTAMPITSSLAYEVQERLDQRGSPVPPQHQSLFGENLEAWLTYLVGEQPWLSRSQNLRNHALFYEAAEEIAAILIRQQNEALKDAMPEWLKRLVGWWADHRATVMTFNYDTLVEKAAADVLDVVDGSPFHGSPR